MSDQSLIAAPGGLSPSRLRGTAASLAQLILSIPAWPEVRRVRRHLAGFDDHLLADIGLTRERVLREAEKWPWQ